jgi:hypothetical protein
MEFIVRSVRAWSVPMVLPVAQAWRVFDEDGGVRDDLVAGQLQALGRRLCVPRGRWSCRAGATTESRGSRQPSTFVASARCATACGKVTAVRRRGRCVE